MANHMTRKELEFALRERSQEHDRLIRSLQNCDRRHFLKVSLGFAAMAATAGVIQPQSFQLVKVARAAGCQISASSRASRVSASMAGSFPVFRGRGNG